jgi:hypothetical protein
MITDLSLAEIIEYRRIIGSTPEIDFTTLIDAVRELKPKAEAYDSQLELAKGCGFGTVVELANAFDKLIAQCDALDQALQDAGMEIDRLTREKDAAEKACAEMREALRSCRTVRISDGTVLKEFSSSKVSKALSTNAGKYFVRKEKP